MFPFSKCIAVGLMIATVIVSNFDSKDKDPMDFE